MSERVKLRWSTLSLRGAISAIALSASVALADASPHARFDIHIGLGNFKPQDDTKLTRRDGEYSFDFGVGMRHSRHLAWEIGWLHYSQEVDAPVVLNNTLVGVRDEKAGLSVSGFGGAIKLMQPAGDFDFYVGGGPGYYKAKIAAYAINPFTLQTTEVSRSDERWGWQVLAGVDLRASPNSVWSFQYRRMALNADFGNGIGTTTVGGWMWQLFYRASFGRCDGCSR